MPASSLTLDQAGEAACVEHYRKMISGAAAPALYVYTVPSAFRLEGAGALSSFLPPSMDRKCLAVPLWKHCMVGTCRDAVLSVSRKPFVSFPKEGRKKRHGKHC